MQGPSRTLNDDWRRADTNNYLRVCHTHAQHDPAYRDEQTLLQRHQTSGIATLRQQLIRNRPLPGEAQLASPPVETVIAR
jgi:hypothetical protein